MQPLSVFYSRILPYLPGCSEPLVNQVLVSSAIDFAESSLVLRQNLDSFKTVAGVTQYDLDPPTANHDIDRVMSVAIDGRELSPGLYEATRNDMPTAQAKPRGFFTDRTDNVLTLKLSPPPDSKYTVVVAVNLRPSMNATQLDDDLFNMWSDAVASGAIARAMQIPDQPFTNFARAQQLMDSVARQINSARIDGNYGSIRGSMRVRYRPFA
jgi:hypothetical protein